LQTSLIQPDTKYEHIPRDDESEAALVNPNGIGDPSYLDVDDIKDYAMANWGLEIPDFENLGKA
jgi:hypothetical protein